LFALFLLTIVIVCTSKEKGQTMIYKTLQRRTDNNNGQKKKGETMIYKTLHRRTDNNNGQKKKGKQ
jgi:hypothetical protein